MDGREWLLNSFDRKLQDIKNEYARSLTRNSELCDLIDSLESGEKFKELERELDYYKTRSIYILYGKEKERYDDFINEHCGCDCKSKQINIELTGTGLGDCITLRCPVCGSSEDITDTDEW